MTDKKPKARFRSGWVSDEQRHTVRLLVRCSPELAARARALDATLAEVLAAGIAALETRQLGRPT